MRKILQKNIIIATFIKKNGEKREMVCTLIETMLPKTNGKLRDLPDNLITVFDVEVNEWRTLNLDTLISYKVID